MKPDSALQDMVAVLLAAAVLLLMVFMGSLVEVA